VDFLFGLVSGISAGIINSALEHATPEQLFNTDPAIHPMHLVQQKVYK